MFAWTAQPYGPGTAWYGTTWDDALAALRSGNRIAILAGDGPDRAHALAKKYGYTQQLCCIYLETGDGTYYIELDDRAVADPARNVVLAREQLAKSRGWDAHARESSLPYHFVNALEPADDVFNEVFIKLTHFRLAL
jgi:hypothetical protein